MSEQATAQDYWNSRAAEWDSYSPPLIPSQPDLDFMRDHVVANSKTLVLGATPELCTVAQEAPSTVTAVDYAAEVIAELRRDGVDYTCEDWQQFLGATAEQYDTVLTDGGLLCLEFPGAWRRIASQIREHLNPGGTFAARVYVNTLRPPQEIYENPNLNRFVTSMGRASEVSSWMVRPAHPDYAAYDIEYAFPPEPEILKIFAEFELIDKLVPDYEEGERFVSYAWQRCR